MLCLRRPKERTYRLFSSLAVRIYLRYRPFLASIHTTVSQAFLAYDTSLIVCFSVHFYLYTNCVSLHLLSLFRALIRIASVFVTICSKPWVEAYLCLSLSFDALAFLSLTFMTMRASRSHYLSRIIKVIRNDGILVSSFVLIFNHDFVWRLIANVVFLCPVLV